MGKYDNTVNPGDTRVRIGQMIARNPIESDVPKTLTCLEQEVVRRKDGTESVINRKTRECQLAYTEASADTELPLVHPVSGEVVGKVTLGYAYMVLHSLGRLAQITKDAEETAPRLQSPAS